MRSWQRIFSLALVCVAFTGFVTPAAVAATRAPRTPTPGIYPPGSKIFGHTYAQLSASWWRWSFQTPLHGPKGQIAQAIAPFTGKVNCRYAQKGDVWFIAPPLNAATSPVNRTCTVPQGKALFFPVYDAWADNLNYPGQPPTTYTSKQLRQQAAGYLANASSLTASLDGTIVADLSDLSSPYRTKAPLWHYTLPADSWLNAYFNQTWPAGTTTPPPGAAADGVYVAVKPLSAGTHTLTFGATGSGLDENVTYTIKVPAT